VAAHDAARAADALEAVEERAPSAAGGSWICPQCQAEVDEGFDVCWSCERERESAGDSEDQRQHPIASGQFTSVTDEQEVAAAADAAAMRAWRAAILSIALPPLVLYALYLIVKNMHQPMSPPAKRRYYAALAAIGVILAAMLVGWSVAFRNWDAFSFR